RLLWLGLGDGGDFVRGGRCRPCIFPLLIRRLALDAWSARDELECRFRRRITCDRRGPRLGDLDRRGRLEMSYGAAEPRSSTACQQRECGEPEDGNYREFVRHGDDRPGLERERLRSIRHVRLGISQLDWHLLALCGRLVVEL